MVEVTLDNTIGALLIGTVVASILFGINSLQAFVYFNRFPNDSIRVKSMVTSLWVLDLFHLVLIVRSVYFYCVTSFANPEALTRSTWELIAQILITITSDTAIRFFFVWRIYALKSRTRILIPVMLALSMVCFVASVVYTAKAYQIKLIQDVHKIQNIFYVVYSSAVAVDLLITGVLVFSLGDLKIGTKRSDSILRLLSIYSVNTGVLTCLSHIAILLTFIFLPNNLIYAAIYICSSKWLTGSFLGTLNAREKLRKISIEGQTFQLSTAIWNPDAASDEERQRHISSAISMRFNRTVNTMDMDIDIGNIKIYDNIEETEAAAYDRDRIIEIGPAINPRVTPEPSEPSPADSHTPLKPGAESDRLDSRSCAGTTLHSMRL